MGEFVPPAAKISSPYGKGFLIRGEVLLGIVCILYNMMGCMAVVYDTEAVMQCCVAEAVMQCCDAEAVMQCYDVEAMMQCYDAEAIISIGP